MSDAAEKSIVRASFTRGFAELIKIRVSQINSCAFCLNMHTPAAIKAGESTGRLAVLAALWESQYFTNLEQAALALAEEITHLEPARKYTVSTEILTEEQYSAVSWLAIVMNSRNRIAITSHYPVTPEAQNT